MWWTLALSMIKLLSAILAHLPRLPGASCIGKHRMYDPVLGGLSETQLEEVK
jgi:hypothetical protein